VALLSQQLKRLLAFVRPYRAALIVGIAFLAIVALAEGAVTLMIVPIFDRVLAN
jgi:ABC-type multidrug transport system fused ATPase/permease subunit